MRVLFLFTYDLRKLIHDTRIEKQFTLIIVFSSFYFVTLQCNFVCYIKCYIFSNPRPKTTERKSDVKSRQQIFKLPHTKQKSKQEATSFFISFNLFFFAILLYCFLYLIQISLKPTKIHLKYKNKKKFFKISISYLVARK